MSLKLTLPLLVALSGSLGVTSPASGQLALGTSLTLATPYVWRGVTHANGATLQPEIFLGIGLAQGYLTAGGWGNLETGSPSPGNLSDLGPDRPGWSEVDFWVQFARTLGQVETTIGGIRYTYHGSGPGAVRTSSNNTAELYASVQLPSTYLVPRLSAYMDVDHVRGVYLEASATTPLLAFPFGNPVVIYANALAGYNLGQDLNPDRPGQGANFRHDGFTHFDLSLRTTLRLGKKVPLVINLEPHWQLKVDPFTKRTSPEAGDAERNLQFWLGLSLSTSFSLVSPQAP